MTPFFRGYKTRFCQDLFFLDYIVVIARGDSSLKIDGNFHQVYPTAES